MNWLLLSSLISPVPTIDTTAYQTFWERISVDGRDQLTNSLPSFMDDRERKESTRQPEQQPILKRTAPANKTEKGNSQKSLYRNYKRFIAQ